MSKKRVAIICGGRSSEHSISCISAKGVLEAIDRNLFEPILIGITLRGKWVALKSADDFGVGSDGLPIIPDTAPGINADVHGLKNAEGAPLAHDEVDLPAARQVDDIELPLAPECSQQDRG